MSQKVYMSVGPGSLERKLGSSKRPSAASSNLPKCGTTFSILSSTATPSALHPLILLSSVQVLVNNSVHLHLLLCALEPNQVTAFEAALEERVTLEKKGQPALYLVL